MQPHPHGPISIQIVLFDGFDPLDAIAPYEVFWAANLFEPAAVEVDLVGVTDAGPVRSGTGLLITPTGRLDPSLADIVVVPGAAGPLGDPDDLEPDPASIPAILGRTLLTELPSLLDDALSDPTCVVVGVCGGSLIPAMAGLVEGRPSVTHHLGMDLLDATGARAVSARVVDDGDLITCGGVTSGLDLALHVVERFIGPRVAHEIEVLFEFERRGVVWRDDSSARGWPVGSTLAPAAAHP